VHPYRDLSLTWNWQGDKYFFPSIGKNEWVSSMLTSKAVEDYTTFRRMGTPDFDPAFITNQNGDEWQFLIQDMRQQFLVNPDRNSFMPSASALKLEEAAHSSLKESVTVVPKQVAPNCNNEDPELSDASDRRQRATSPIDIGETDENNNAEGQVGSEESVGDGKEADGSDMNSEL